MTADRSGTTTPPWLKNRIFAECDNKTTAAEIGCGSGRLTKELSEKCDTVLGVDINEDRIRLAAEHGSPVALSSATNLPLRDKSVDIIVSIEVIEHIPQSEKMFKQAARILSENGTMYIKTPNLLTHDLYKLVHFDFQRDRDIHPNLYWHRKFSQEVGKWFDVDFYDVPIAQYQVDKIKDANSMVASVVDSVPFKQLPKFCQPSIVARCTPK